MYVETENRGVLQRWYRARQIKTTAVPLRQALIQLVVCISATRGNMPDEKLLANGSEVPAREGWILKVANSSTETLLALLGLGYPVCCQVIWRFSSYKRHMDEENKVFFHLVIRRWQEQRLPLRVASHSVFQILEKIDQTMFFVMSVYACGLPLWQCTFLDYAQEDR